MTHSAESTPNVIRRYRIYVHTAILLCFFGTLVPAAAQSTGGSDAGVFAPFVNKLRTAVKDPQIRLTWEDISGFTGTYVVYRHNAEITAENIAQSVKVAEVKQGEQYYTDVPPAAGLYYYAVVAKEPSGTVYELYIPFRNKTITPTAIASTATQEDQSTLITSLTATANADSVSIRFQSTRNTREITLYRATSPLTKADDLVTATPVATTTGRIITLVDYAVPGVPYYYAAADAEALSANAWQVVAGSNALAAPVEIPLGNQPVELPGLTDTRPIRAMPLPILTLPNLTEADGLIADTNPVRVSEPLDAITSERLARLSTGLTGDRTSARFTKADFLPSDRLVLDGKLPAPTGGESKVLNDILKKTFTVANWEEAIQLLGNFLSLQLSPEMHTRGHFYLGQAYYLAGEYRQAFLEFLYVQDDLDEYARSWADNTLALSSSW